MNSRRCRVGAFNVGLFCLLKWGGSFGFWLLSKSSCGCLERFKKGGASMISSEFQLLIASGLGGFIKWQYDEHKSYCMDPRSRNDLACKLRKPDVEVGYGFFLKNVLSFLEAAMVKPFSFGGYILCYSLAVLYVAFTYMLSWALGGNLLGNSILGLPIEYTIFMRCLFVGVLFLYSIFVFHAYRTIQSTRVYQWSLKFLYQYLKRTSKVVLVTPIYPVLIVPFFHVFELFKFNLNVGVFSWAVLSLALLFVDFGLLLLFVSPFLWLLAILMFFGGDAVSHSDLIFILFCFVLPLLNSLFDWVSLSFSWVLGEKLYLKRRWLDLLKYLSIDLGAAIVCVVLFTCMAVAVGEIYGVWALEHGYNEVLPVENLILNVSERPLSPASLWINFMIFSSLVPTFVHFMLVFSYIYIAYLPEKLRNKIADRAEYASSQIDYRPICWYYAFRWPVSAVCTFLLGWVLCKLIPGATEFLPDVAYWTRDTVKALL